ncbi:hypothetical protein [Pedobacter panaciterrae]|uniref:hypothetical protein n=1 Tax=Pedobacter panaciterrae TaxID=363849 RepID=UPI002598F7B3|nr:hypothetical protein [uncultured Pedobacter sp.]
MSVMIFGAIASPRNLPDGSETTVKITFQGRAIMKDETNVEVDFTISPFPDLSFKGSKTDTEHFIFGKTIKTFTKTLVISNKKDAVSKKDLSDGKIRLDATEINTSNHDTTFAALQFK